MPTYEEVLDTIKPNLKSGEHVVGAVVGAVAGEAFHTVLALTSQRVMVLRGGSASILELSNLASVSWAPAWARLNIDLKVPRKRMVVAVFGSEWKLKAKEFAEAAKRLGAKD